MIDYQSNISRLSTREAALLVKVHDSTVKRWCTGGDLPCSVTPGGHRRIALDALLSFARAHNLSCSLLAFGDLAVEVWQAAGRAQVEEDFSRLVSLANGWLADGRSDLLYKLYRFLLEHQIPPSAIFDRLIAAFMHHVGERWEQGDIEVGDEHRMSQVAFDALYEFRQLLLAGVQASAPVEKRALVGCIGGNYHEMAALMVRTLLEADGWQTLYLGGAVPAEDFALQQRKHDAELVCISLCPPLAPSDAVRLARKLGHLYDSDHPYRLAIGGQILQDEELSDSAAYPFEDCRLFRHTSNFLAWIRSFSTNRSAVG